MYIYIHSAKCAIMTGGMIMGIFVEIEKEELKKLNKKFLRGFCYISEDLQTVLLIKPENAKKHEYVIPGLDEAVLPPIANAIFEFLQQKKEKREEVIINKCHYLAEDSIHEIRKKLIHNV